VERIPKVTVESDLQPEKQPSPSPVPDRGMQIEEGDEQCEIANPATDETGQSDSNVTAGAEPQAEKQQHPSFATEERMRIAEGNEESSSKMSGFQYTKVGARFDRHCRRGATEETRVAKQTIAFFTCRFSASSGVSPS
jgi:hypothetical protein